MFCSILFKGKHGGKCFVGLVVKLEVDKVEVAEMVDKDSGAFVALLGEFAFQLCKKSHSVDVIWSTETHSPGLVATKTLWLALVSLPHQGSFVIAPNRQPAHLGCSTLAASLGFCHRGQTA
jgi:hypothetical protein